MHFLISCKLVQNLVIRWRPLQCFQSWPPGRVTCIATLPWIAILALSVSIELVSSSARVNSVQFYKGVLVCDGLTSGPKDRTPGLPGSDKKSKKNSTKKSVFSISIGPWYTWVPIYGSKPLSLTDWLTERRLCRLDWCDSGWWRYQLNTNW